MRSRMKRFIERSACVLCLVLLSTGRLVAATLPPAAAQHVVALYTYHLTKGELQPSASFTGLLVSPRHIITSSDALLHGHESMLATEGGVPTQTFAVFSLDGKQYAIALNTLLGKDKLPVSVLEVRPEDRGLTGRYMGEPPQPSKLESPADAIAVGVVSPYGLYPDALADRRVPGPVALTIKFGGDLKTLNGQGEARLVKGVLPLQMTGAGVWDSDAKLIGVLLHRDDVWMVMDAVSVAKQLAAEPEIVSAIADGNKPPKPDPTPTPPDTTEPPVTTTPPVKPDNPVKPVTPEGTGLQAQLKPLLNMIAEQGGRPVVDLGLLDYVKQDQADMAMSLIAMGKPADALKLIDDIEPLASGALAEQLNYRRALAQILTGNLSKALECARQTQNAKDELVRARGALLMQALEENSSGTFHGQPISQADVLARAIKAQLTDVKHDMDVNFDAIKAYPISSKSAYDRIMVKISELKTQIASHQLAWPGFFDELSAQVDQNTQRIQKEEYERSFVELRDLYSRYQSEKRQTQYMEGPEWSTPGSVPAEHVDGANTAALAFNDLLKHYRKLDAVVPAGTRRSLSPEMSDPLVPLTLARHR
ncbi:MAG: hypothetical protein GC162_12995 [Planctomycetes bacterium]|nr:hypothetical protein [Planctomycetota bacterium]